MTLWHNKLRLSAHHSVVMAPPGIEVISMWWSMDQNLGKVHSLYHFDAGKEEINELPISGNDRNSRESLRIANRIRNETEPT